MIESPTNEELELLEAGRDYRELKRMAGYRRLIKHLVSYCNVREEELRSRDELDDRQTLRLVDRWRASEALYQEIVTEVEGTIRQLEAKETELRGLGIEYPELSIGQTAREEIE